MLVENSLYWLLGTVNLGEILEFDLERQSLAVVHLPVGGLGFLFVSGFTAQAQLWKRKTDCDDVVSWRLTRAIELDKLLSLDFKEKVTLGILGYAEENNVLLLWTVFSIFTVQLESLKYSLQHLHGPA
jgi:hypothetical protein